MEFTGLVKKIAMSLYKQTSLYSLEDLIQIGLLSVHKTAKHFREGRNTKKSTFLALCAKRDMVRFIKKHREDFKNVKGPLMDIAISEYLPLKEELPSLEPEEYEIAQMLYDGYKKYEIAKRLQISKKDLEHRLLVIGEKIRNA
jgi:RNA polymerase sigma factor (sigma-70 family)